LRAAVLGADDGIVSTSALLVGVVAGGGDRAAVMTAGIAGLAAGACSMAAGEYVSVSSQRDAEQADLLKEAEELATEPEAEEAELAAIYMHRGLSAPLARAVASELSGHGGEALLETHARDELGLDPRHRARPVQAAAASAAAFSAGAALAVLTAAIAPGDARSPLIVCVALIALAVLGALGAIIGGARPLRPAARVVIGGAAAMAITAAIGAVTGAVVT
jgi:VIT1/CCC1 family predicted Fe2+/Mn2+ transporter